MNDHENLKAPPLRAKLYCDACAEHWTENFAEGTFLKQKGKRGVHMRDHDCGLKGRQCRWVTCPKCGTWRGILIAEIVLLDHETGEPYALSYPNIGNRMHILGKRVAVAPAA